MFHQNQDCEIDSEPLKMFIQINQDNIPISPFSLDFFSMLQVVLLH